MDTMGAALWDLYENQRVKGLSAAMRKTLFKIEKSGHADHRWFNAMGELAMQEKSYPLAARFYKQAMDEKPMAEYELNLGNALFYAGDFRAAKSRLAAYLEKHPGDVHGLIDLANCHLQLRELGKVKDLCNAGLAQKAARAPLLNCLGHVAYLEGKHEQAWDYFDKAYAEAPEYTDSLFNRANSAYRLGRLEDALADFAMCVRKDENYEAALLNIAIVQLEQGRLAEGRLAIRQLLKLNPDHVEALHVMGRLCLAGKEFRAARDAFRDALKRDENHTPTLLALAKLHIQEMEQEDAGKVLRRLLARQGLGEEERIATLTLLMEMGEHAQCVEFILLEAVRADVEIAGAGPLEAGQDQGSHPGIGNPAGSRRRNPGHAHHAGKNAGTERGGDVGRVAIPEGPGPGSRRPGRRLRTGPHPIVARGGGEGGQDPGKSPGPGAGRSRLPL
jgi:tetratricopeptide (TPR) repeat protein